MKTEEFRYLKLYYYGKMVAALLLAGFVAYFTYKFYKDFMLLPAGPTFLLYFSLTIISLMMIVLLSILISGAKIAFLSAPALAINEEKLVINGKREFAWNDIDYIEYVKSRMTRTAGRGARGQRVYYLYVKPEYGRKVKVEITKIDRQHSEIFAALKHYAPHLEIKGWKD